MSLLLNRDPERADQAGFIALKALEKPWIRNFMVFAGRTFPVVPTRLKAAERLRNFGVRWGFGRMRYAILPGLYAVGRPTEASEVFVSANYKRSFDALRVNLTGMDAWILVLDTKGINVWCAAGEGTFGTEELVSRIGSLKLGSLVSHRSLILPQLGAPGVSAPETAKRTGFRIIWGPVRAADIPAWLRAGKVKDEAMRTVAFGIRDRMAVAPMEIVHGLPLILAAFVLAALYGLPLGRWWAGRALPAALVLGGAIPVGTVLFPALLPWLPTRAFSIKGAFLGVLWAGILSFALGLPLLASIGAILLSASAVSFLAMNFTGSSTFTSQPGANLEVTMSFWPLASSLIIGLGAFFASKFIG
jgi:hypothetical protein